MQYRGSYAETMVQATKAALLFAGPPVLGYWAMIVAVWAFTGGWPQEMTQGAIARAEEAAFDDIVSLLKILGILVGGTAAVFAVGMWAMYCWNRYVKRDT